LKKGGIPLVTRKRWVVSGKERRSNPDSKRSYPGAKLPRREATQTPSHPESRIYTIPRRTYSNLKPGLKVKLNSTTMATFAFHIPSIEAVQSISESELFHCRLMKTLKGVLLTL